MMISISLNYLLMAILGMFLTFSCGLQPIFAESKNDNNWLEKVSVVLKKYNASSGIKMSVTKELHLELLDEEKKSTGSLLFKKGNLNLKIEKPDYTQVIMNSRKVWVVQKKNFNEKKKTLVTLFKKPTINSKTKAPIAFLLSDIKVWEQFNLVNSKNDGNFLYLALKPKDVNRMPDVVYLKLKLNLKTQSIISLSLTDELENITAYKFSNIKFSQKISSSEFNYKIPKGADVTSF